MGWIDSAGGGRKISTIFFGFWLWVVRQIKSLVGVRFAMGLFCVVCLCCFACVVCLCCFVCVVLIVLFCSAALTFFCLSKRK